MSYEKKIRDLMNRLAAMSPEPPPYPEEMTMARPEARKSLRPALVFATAAALVAVLAIPLLLFTGGGDPIGADTTTTTSTATTMPATSTTTVPATTTSTEPGVTTTQALEGTSWTGVVFVYQSPDNSFSGNPGLIPLNLEVTAPPGTFSDHTDFTQILGLLADSGPGLPEPFENAIPSDVRLVWWGEEDGTVRPDMNEAFRAGAGGLLADMTMLNQLIYGLTWMNEEARVLFTVDDEPVEAYGSEGLVLTDPVGRDSFLDHLHIINLTSPIVRQADGSYLVEGIANVFEATVIVAVVDGAGDVVHEEFVSATCGTGCWGEFSTTIDGESIVPGESSVRIFTYSAQDGSVVDAITVPIPENGVWEYAVGG
ncbi:MAG TPA: Gmad2 immunoglobulin-like domain-containing protein [Acidimicrobiia bacterium]|nr:Gmad2 immunoglobulin-like domain-containing protein [Acidimicrobiia bacterium]